MSSNPKVTVLMPTYNHETYIAQAIESFVAQVCDFDTLLLIGDDCSTDNTLTVAKEFEARYTERIKVVESPKNLGLLGNYKQLLALVDSPYIAILESDDYWTDPNKLQMQVDFLDTHPRYGMVYSDHTIVDDYGNITPSWCSKFNPIPQGDIYERLLKNNPICAATAMFVKSKMDHTCSIDEFIEHKFRTVDYPLWLAIAGCSEIGYIANKTAVYRMLGSSISNSASWDKIKAFNQNMFDVKRYAVNKYGSKTFNPKIIDKLQYKRMAYLAFKYHRFPEMLRYAMKYLF